MSTKVEQEVIGDTVTGNSFVDLDIELVTYFEDVVRITHQEREGIISDILSRDDLAKQLNIVDVPDFTAFLITLEDQEDSEEDDNLKSKWEIRIYCAPSTLGE